MLQAMAAAARAGTPIARIEADAKAQLVRDGFKPDYAAIRRASDLGETTADSSEPRVALIAARVGTTRLIDNLLI